MKFVIILTLCLSYLITFPSDDVWEILSKLRFDMRFDEKLDDVIFTPKPNTAIKKLQGKKIVIQGFKANLLFFEKDAKLEENIIFLCRFNEQKFGCCSILGAESYIKIQSNKTINIVEGKPYLFEGIFELNIEDYQKLPFSLKGAQCLNCK